MIKLKNTLNITNGSICYILLKDQPYNNEEASILEELKNKKIFSAEKKTFYSITKSCNNNLKNIFFIGCGIKEEVTTEILRESIYKACKKANELKESCLSFYLNSYFMKDKWIRTIAEGISLSNYSFDKYLTDKKENILKDINIVIPVANSFKEALNEGICLGKMIKINRDLTNESGNICTPQYLADKTKELGKKFGFKTKIYDKKEIKKFKMEAYLAVSKGSKNDPKFIVIEYNNNKKNTKKLGLVGKGITFDSGGISLKPSKSMLTMQGDMSGAATVICAISAIAYLKLPINIIGVIPSCENMISEKSYLPNDIIKSRSGKTIFIKNTDAEGRLTLIDAIDYIAKEKKVNYIVDIATLTGSAELVLGKKIAPVITNDSNFLKYLKKASKITGEKIWELPNDDDFLKLIKSPYADLNNSGGHIASTITAGLFLGSVIDNIPWIHIDIAGTFWTEVEEGCFSKGATGFGTRLLYQLAKELSNYE